MLKGSKITIPYFTHGPGSGSNKSRAPFKPTGQRKNIVNLWVWFDRGMPLVSTRKALRPWVGFLLPSSVSCIYAKKTDEGVPTHVLAQMRFDGGRTASFMCSFVAAFRDDAEVFGEKAALSLDYFVVTSSSVSTGARLTVLPCVRRLPKLSRGTAITAAQSAAMALFDEGLAKDEGASGKSQKTQENVWSILRQEHNHGEGNRVACVCVCVPLNMFWTTHGGFIFPSHDFLLSTCRSILASLHHLYQGSRVVDSPTRSTRRRIVLL